MNIDDFAVGDHVRLRYPIRGYKVAEVIGFDFPHILLRFSSGMEISEYADAIEEKI